MAPTRLWLFLFSVLALAATGAANTWVSIPIHGPARLEDTSRNRHQVDISLGTPPQNASFFVSIAGSSLFALTPQCIFCPPEGGYDPKYSSTAKLNPVNRIGNGTFGGIRGRETVMLGGILQDIDSPLAYIEAMSPTFSARISGGHIGIFVPATNETEVRQQSIIHRLDEQGQLLNPVWGLRLGGEDPRLTIGALDPSEYQGEINWVPVIQLNGGPGVRVDALRGNQGTPLPFQYPLTAWMDSFARSILIPDLPTYMMNETLLGPQEWVNMDTTKNQSFGILCNDTMTPNTPIEFSVDINGVTYPVNKLDLVRPASYLSRRGYCNVGVAKSSDATFGLGVTFLRSVYLAYRFPTDSCPGYWGFATPRGFPTPASTQKPRVIPTDADKCLSFVTPTSTPTPTIASYTGLLGGNGKKYQVYSKSDVQVELRGVDDLKLRKITGGSA